MSAVELAEHPRRRYWQRAAQIKRSAEFQASKLPH
jgi:hypothetical protein